MMNMPILRRTLQNQFTFDLTKPGHCIELLLYAAVGVMTGSSFAIREPRMSMPFIAIAVITKSLEVTTEYIFRCTDLELQQNSHTPTDASSFRPL